MSDNGSQKSFRNSTFADSTHSYISGNGVSKGQEKRTSAVSNSSANGIQPELSQKYISDAITKQAHAIQQAAARLQQQHQHEQPVMAKKSNISPTSNRSNIQGPSGMVQLNLVNENGIVTPIEINASVAAAAAIVVAQKHQNHKLEAGAINNFISASMNSTSVANSLGNSPKSNDAGAKSSKIPPHGNIGLSFNVSYLRLSLNFCSALGILND